MANDCDIASGFPTVYSRHDTPALFLLLASIQSISGTDSASQVLLFEARSVKARPSPRDHVTNKHKLLLRREKKNYETKIPARFVNSETAAVFVTSGQLKMTSGGHLRSRKKRGGFIHYL